MGGMSVRRRHLDSDAAKRIDLARIEHHPPRDLREVPEKPSMEMLTAGSLAGGVSVESAWNIWQAMLRSSSRNH